MNKTRIELPYMCNLYMFEERVEWIWENLDEPPDPSKDISLWRSVSQIMKREEMAANHRSRVAFYFNDKDNALMFKMRWYADET